MIIYSLFLFKVFRKTTRHSIVTCKKMCEPTTNSAFTCPPPLCCPVFQTPPDQGRRRCFLLDWPHYCVQGCCQLTFSLLHLQDGGWLHQCVASESAAWPGGWYHSPGAGAKLCAEWKHCSSKTVRCWDQTAPTTGCHQSVWCKPPVEGPTHIPPSAGWRTYAPVFLAQ